MTVFSSESWRASAFSRSKALSTVFTLWITVCWNQCANHVSFGQFNILNLTHTFHSNPLQSKYLEISPYWQVSPSYPLEQKQLLFRMQIPACLQGGSHVALGSKTKGRATPRGPSDPPRQIPARAASATSKSCMDVQQSTAIFISTLLQGSRRTESAGECMFGQHTALWSSTGQTWYCRGPQLEKY